MNREYIETLFDYIPPGRRDIILRTIKGSIPGFRSLSTAAARKPEYLKNTLKTNEKLCGRFLSAVATVYNCSIRKYERPDRLPEMTERNFLGQFAWKCYNLDTSAESCRELEHMLEWYEQALAEREAGLDKDTDEIEELEIQRDMDDPEDQVQDSLDEGDIMPKYTQYIGYIQETNYFYNFWPTNVIQHDGSVEPKTDSEMEKIFPDYGNIQLFSKQRDYVKRNYRPGDIRVITISLEEDLIDNERSDIYRKSTKYKVDINKLEYQGKIKRLKNYGIYPVLHPVGVIDFSKKTIPVIEGFEDVDVNDLYVVEEDGILYGPFEVRRIDVDQYEVILPDNYVVMSYRSVYSEINFIEIQTEIQKKEHHTKTVCLNDEFLPEEIDTISDEDLLQPFLTSASKKEMSVEDYVSSAFRDVSESIKQQRGKRIRDFLETQLKQEDVREDIVKFVAALLCEDGGKYPDLLDRILDDKALAAKIQSFDIVQKRVDEMRNKYEEAKLHREEEEARIKAAAADEERRISEIAQKTSAEIRSLTIQKDALLQEISALEKEQNGRKKIADLEAEQKSLEAANDYLRETERGLKEKTEEAEKILKEKLASSIANVVDAAFDGRIADEIFKAAGKWNRDQQHQKFKEVANCLVAKDEAETLVGEELVNYLLGAVNRYRKDYGKNDILNIFICIAQNFLTVFSGEPGTGKTSICNIIAHILGTGKISDTIPDHYNININRYVPISVERGWTSKRDFIGYYNPLSQTFEKANKHLYDGLRLLDAESKLELGSQYPLIILLDEANLSPIEYYWADFMNICDSDSPLNKITLGDDIQLQIPPTLRFTATINNDDTTEKLSPRLLDRASLIRLPDVEYVPVKDENLEDQSFVKIISWAELQETFCSCADEELDSTSNEIYKEISSQFKKMRISISPRVYKAIKNYWITAKDLFEKEEGYDPAIIALDYAVAQRLLPKINGSGDSYRDSLIKLREICEKRNLTKCRKILQDIIERGESSMNYYQYF